MAQPNRLNRRFLLVSLGVTCHCALGQNLLARIRNNNYLHDEGVARDTGSVNTRRRRRQGGSSPSRSVSRSRSGNVDMLKSRINGDDCDDGESGDEEMEQMPIGSARESDDDDDDGSDKSFDVLGSPWYLNEEEKEDARDSMRIRRRKYRGGKKSVRCRSKAKKAKSGEGPSGKTGKSDKSGKGKSGKSGKESKSGKSGKTGKSGKKGKTGKSAKEKSGKTNAPTPRPQTESPTFQPTESPTLPPTEFPTFFSTLSYTFPPTVSPPTVSPSIRPTATPSTLPTESHEPSLAPSPCVGKGCSRPPNPLFPTHSPAGDAPTAVPTDSHSPSLAPSPCEGKDCSRPPNALFPTQSPAGDTPTLIPTAVPTPSPTPGSSSSGGNTFVLTPTDDATIIKSRGNENFGDNKLLRIDIDSGVKNFLVKFDTSGIGSDKTIESAILRLYAVDKSDFGGTCVTTKDVSWNEDTITWNNAPPADGKTVGTIDRIENEMWYELDVTSAVTLGDIFSLRVYSSISNQAAYSSKENENEKPPELVITVAGSPSPSSIPSLEPSVCVGKGCDRPPNPTIPTESPTETRVPTKAPVDICVLVLTPTDDATIIMSQSSENFGDTETLKVDGDMGVRNALLRFATGSIISDSIISATLRMFSTGSSPSQNIFVTASATDWDEGTVTWDNAPLVQGAELGTLENVEGEWYEVDVSAAVTPDIPTSFRVATTGSNHGEFSSKENPNGNKPELVVTFPSSLGGCETQAPTDFPVSTPSPTSTPTIIRSPSLNPSINTDAPTPCEGKGCDRPPNLRDNFDKKKEKEKKDKG